MSWHPKRLDQLGTVARGRSRHRPRDAAHLYDGSFPFIQTGDVKHAGLYIDSYSQTYSDAGLAQSKLWPAGTLCITIAANIADTAILSMDSCFPDSIIGFTADATKSDTRFIKYLFDASIRLKARQFSQGATQDNLSQEKLLSLEFNVPDISVQRRIADFVSNYDLLIENNRRRMTLLEESARLLHLEWFVRLRFPGYKNTRIVNGVPEGWQSVPTPEAIDVNPKTKLSDADVHRYVEMADLPTSSMVISSSIFRDGRSGAKFQNGDTLFARITPCLENGKTGFVDFLEPGEVGRGSTEFIVLRPNRVSGEFVYCMSRTYEFRANAIKSMIGASGRQRVQESCFQKYFIFVPSRAIQKAFGDIVEPIFRQIKNLNQQNQKLRTARDLILPRLMSGEITV